LKQFTPGQLRYSLLVNRSRCAALQSDVNTCAIFKVALTFARRHIAPNTWEKRMAWKAPKIVEVPVGMEINMYACAARK
jgi:coenzyme PQQ precursor peptide PqqA